MVWNPQLYLKNAGPRLRPALDLLAQASLAASNRSTPVNSILDLGCGPGNITSFLNGAFPEASIHCLDSSEEMLAAAKKAIPSSIMSKCSFAQSTIEECAKKSVKYDLIYCNAALHWVNDHNIITPLVSNALGEGGIVAVSMPDTRIQPSHTLMKSALRSCGLTTTAVIPSTKHDFDFYYSLLQPLCRDINMWSTEFIHALPVDTSAMTNDRITHPVLTFTSATGLQPVVESLGGAASSDGKRFLDEYNKLLYNIYPLNYEGERAETRFSFRRFFFVAVKR